MFMTACASSTCCSRGRRLPSTARCIPIGLDFVVGVLRWHNRVAGYALVLVTDEYPPFRLSA
jgi:hypothetical protein